jgi:hypothetical protein
MNVMEGLTCSWLKLQQTCQVCSSRLAGQAVKANLTGRRKM